MENLFPPSRFKPLNRISIRLQQHKIQKIRKEKFGACPLSYRNVGGSKNFYIADEQGSMLVALFVDRYPVVIAWFSDLLVAYQPPAGDDSTAIKRPLQALNKELNLFHALPPLDTAKNFFEFRGQK